MCLKFSKTVLCLGSENLLIGVFAGNAAPLPFRIKKAITTKFQLKAKDMDCGSNAVVSYSFQDDVDTFKIGSSDGKICLDQQLDHETKDVHNVIVLATDRGDDDTSHR